MNKTDEPATNSPMGEKSANKLPEPWSMQNTLAPPAESNSPAIDETDSVTNKVTNVSPNGDTVFRKVKPLTKTEKKLYEQIVGEINEDIAVIEQSFARLGRNLKIMRDNPRLLACGGYQSFSEFCRAEFGSRQQAYRLMQAYDVLQDLLGNGVREVDLPRSESLCREIRRLETPEEQAKIWKTVQGIAKERNRPPKARDIDEAIGQQTTPSVIARQQDEVLKRYDRVDRLLKVGLRADTLDQMFRVKLLTRLVEISESVNVTITVLRREQETPEGDT